MKMDAEVDDAREEIDAVDRELLAMLNRRLELVKRLHQHKIANGIPIRDLDREESMLTRLQEANPGPFTAEAVAELFRHVIDLTRREIHGV